MLATVAAADSASTVRKKYGVLINSEAEPHAMYAIYKQTRTLCVFYSNGCSTYCNARSCQLLTADISRAKNSIWFSPYHYLSSPKIVSTVSRFFFIEITVLQSDKCKSVGLKKIISSDGPDFFFWLLFNFLKICVSCMFYVDLELEAKKQKKLG